MAKVLKLFPDNFFPPKDVAKCFFKAQAHARGWLYKGGPCDPSAGTNAAGVGVITRKPLLNIQVTPITEAYRDLIGGGAR